MTTNEKLERIAAKCRELITKYEDTCHVEMPNAEAGWRSTVAAIACHEMMDGGAAKHFLASEILAAWEGLV